MRQFLDQMAAAGERAAPRLWLGFIGLFWLALCLDAVWWRGLPRFVSWLAPAYLILTIGGWAKVAPALREQDRSPVFWLIALPFIAVGGLTWITTWYLEYPGMASPSYTLLWTGFSFGLAVVLLAAITHRWFRRQLPWSDHTFWGIACLGLLPLWVWLLFVDSFFGWELHGYIARIGLLAIFLSGLAWVIGLVDIQSRRIQALRLGEPHEDQPSAASSDPIPTQPADTRAVFRACTPAEEVAHVKWATKAMAIFMLLWAACPVYLVAGWIFPSYTLLSGSAIEMKILGIYPILMGLGLTLFLYSSLLKRRIERGCLLLVISILPLLAIYSLMEGMGGSLDAMVNVAGIGKLFSGLKNFFALFVAGWLGLIIGGLVRYYRPESRVGFVMAALGALCTLLCWLNPVAGIVPVVGLFKAWQIPSEILDPTIKGLTIILVLAACSLQVAASIVTFMALPSHSQQRQSASGLRAFKLETASFAILLLAVVIAMLCLLPKGLSNTGQFMMCASLLVWGVAMEVAMAYILPFAGADLIIGLCDSPAKRSNETKRGPANANVSVQPFKHVFSLAFFMGPLGLDRFYTGRMRLGWAKLASGIVLPAALIGALVANRYFLLDEVKPDYLRRLAKAQVKSRGWENAVQTPKPGDTARRVAIAQALPEIQDVENQELPFLEKARKAALTVLAQDMFGEAWAAAIRFGPTLAYLEGKGAGHRAGLVNALIDEDEAKKFFQTHRKNPRLTRLKNLSEEDNLALYLVLEDMKWSTAKVRFYKQMAAASVWGGAGLGILPEVVLEMPGRIVAAAWKGNQWALAILAGALLYIVWLIDLILLLLGRYRDGKGRFVHVAPWKSSALKRMGPLEAMNISLTEGRRHIANPFDLDAWYYGRTHQKLKQSLNTTLSYTVLFILIAVLLLLLPGCRDIYEMPAGGGDPQLKRKVVKVQKVKKKVYVVNPFSAILFNPDIERIQLKLEELTKHLYQVGQGKGKGAGFAGGTRRGIVRFIRLRYSSGDWDQDVDLDADLNMLTWYAAQTGHKTAKKPEVRTIRQLGAFPVGKSPPVVYITGQRSLSISRAERETLREYLTTKHGMLFADNGGSSTWHSQFFSLMRQVLPRTDPRPVPLDHPVHDGLPFLPIVAPHGGHTAYMWVVENRIVAYYHPGDIGDAWANGHAGVSRPVWEACYRLGGNVFLYAHSEYSKWLQSRKKKD